MLLIFVPSLTERLHYTMNILFGQLIGTNYTLTTDKSLYTHHKEPKLNYSSQPIGENDLWIDAASLLFENEINLVETCRVDVSEEIISVISSSGGNPDLIASTFYLLSRYEEYFSTSLDHHGRYKSEQSVAFRFGFLQKAMVNRYAYHIRNIIKNRYPNLGFNIPTFQYEITMDIDHPFYNTNIVFWKRVIRLFKSIIELKNNKDLYNTYHVFSKIPKDHSTLFVLCPSIPSQNNSYNKREGSKFKNLLRLLSLKHGMGIHASYFSEQNNLIQEEKNWLEVVTGKSIIKNRFHYLRMKIPNSLLEIEKNGIQKDYTMGYAQENGFRASIANPYPFFDLEKNRTTTLTIVPFCFMDSTFEYKQKKNEMLSEANSAIKGYIKECQTYGGCFVPIFHNDIMKSQSWQKLFNQMIEWLEV